MILLLNIFLFAIGFVFGFLMMYEELKVWAQFIIKMFKKNVDYINNK